jgi:hypothetical protein
MRDSHLVALFLFFVTFTAMWLLMSDESSVDTMRVDPKRVVVLVMNLGASDHPGRVKQILATWGADYPHLYFLTGDEDVVRDFPDVTVTPPVEHDITDRHRLFWVSLCLCV